MDMPTIPLDLEDALSILWQKVCALELQAQEQARTNYRLKTELTASLGIIGLLLTLRAEVVELEEKVKRLEDSQPFTSF
jgi:hypothetical protein